MRFIRLPRYAGEGEEVHSFEFQSIFLSLGELSENNEPNMDAMLQLNLGKRQGVSKTEKALLCK